jgi:hypothetical protein
MAARLRQAGWRRGPEPLLVWIVAAAAGLALLFALWLEVGVQGRDAFWLDEAWTGAVVDQRRWIDVFHQIYWDVNAPLYTASLHAWALVFGLSDAALRAPSLIAATLTPLAIAFAPVQTLGRAERLAWAAIIALWFPGLCFAQEARCYALLLLFASAQTLAFLRLLEEPGTGRALLWTGLAALSILTHYDAAFLGLSQGLIYLATCRGQAVRTWPAALALLPVAGWMAFHWPTIHTFSRPDLAWYSPLQPRQLWPIAGYLAGTQDGLWALALAGAAALTLRFAWPVTSPPRQAEGRPWIVVAASVLAASALIGLGFLRPSFTFRYLTPSAPGVLLGLVLAARGLAGSRRAPLAYGILILASGWIGGAALLSHFRMAPRRYTFEHASAALARERPARLVFLWDHPIDPVLHPEQLSALGGFFLHRQGLSTTVDPVVLAPGEDPNARLLREAQPPGSAILWLYDVAVRGTAAIRHPPALSRIDPSWRCRDYGSRRFGVLACTRPRGSPPSPAPARSRAP